MYQREEETGSSRKRKGSTKVETITPQVTAETVADLTDTQLSELRSNWKAEWASAHLALGSEVGNGTEELLTDPAWLAKKEWERTCFNQVKVLGTELASRRQTTVVGNPPTTEKALQRVTSLWRTYDQVIADWQSSVTDGEMGMAAFWRTYLTDTVKPLMRQAETELLDSLK